MRGCHCKLRPQRLCSLIYSPSFFSDFIVEDFRIQENVVEQTSFVPGGGLTKFILSASNPLTLFFTSVKKKRKQWENTPVMLSWFWGLPLNLLVGSYSWDVREETMGVRSSNAFWIFTPRLFLLFILEPDIWKTLKASWKARSIRSTLCYTQQKISRIGASVACWTSLHCCPIFKVDDDARKNHMFKKRVLSY